MQVVWVNTGGGWLLVNFHAAFNTFSQDLGKL